MNKKKALKLFANRTNIVNKIADGLESNVKKSELVLLRLVIDEFIDKLDKKDGKIENSARNRRLIATIDNVFQEFGKSHGVTIASSILEGVQQIFDFNKQYFSSFNEETKVVPIMNDVKIVLEGWLGIDVKGNVQENGYLSNLIQDTTVRNGIKDFLVRSIIGQSGMTETREALKQQIVGDPKSLGAMQKYYRNFVYDTFSQVDRTAQKIVADKLKLNFAIYEGGLIETSRKFCIEKNGQVFSREEISKFDPPEAKQPDYNPFTDLGGYGCRHHLNFIPDTLAFIIRPDLNK